MGICNSTNNNNNNEVGWEEPDYGQDYGRRHSSAIDKQLEKDHKRKAKEKLFKLMLLGASKGGKSTIFEQLTQIHGKDGNLEKNSKAKPRSGSSRSSGGSVSSNGNYSFNNGNNIDADYIQQCTIIQMQYLVDCCINEFKQALKPESKQALEWLTIQTDQIESNQQSKNKKQGKNDDDNDDIDDNKDESENAPLLKAEEMRDNIELLWNDDAIKNTFHKRDESRNSFDITDSCEYFFDNIKRITHNEYVPSEQDILLTHKPTTGIETIRFSVLENAFEIFDVGGAQTERRKWLQYFDNITAIIYIASLSCYNQFIIKSNEDLRSSVIKYETKDDESIENKDENKDENDENNERKINALIESMDIFNHILNSKDFQHEMNVDQLGIILFLNKPDLFRKKIKKYPLSVCFESYNGANTYEACLEYIRSKFREKNKKSGREIYSHVTCATDKENVTNIFNDVQHHVVVSVLEENGLL